MPPSIVTVSELNRLAREVLETGIPLLWVAGEVSNLTRASSGHLYFSLKDAGAQVRCVMFRSRAQLLPWQLANGQEVEVRALVSLYEPRGDFQLGVEAMRRAGLGRLYEALARLQQRLGDEGLFAAERKRPLPRYPRTIAIVSSPQAAALQDVLAAFRRRAPHVRLQLFPTPVQGDGAAQSIASALAAAGGSDAEVILLVRGGGSIEDLWAFNEEPVARALAACGRPTISGVGHETDSTIADFVADVRAPTPTAAAELATAGWFAAGAELRRLEDRLGHSAARLISRLQQRLDDSARRLVHPASRLTRHRERLDLLGRRLQLATGGRVRDAGTQTLRMRARLRGVAPRPDVLRSRLDIAAHRLRQATRAVLDGAARRLAAPAAALPQLSPEAPLARGYAIVRDADGRIVRAANAIAPGETVRLQLGSGEALARVEKSIPATS